MDGESPRASLIEVLELERDCCARLADLVVAERRAVATRDLSGLLEAVKEREILQVRWQHAKAARTRADGCSPDADASADPALARLRAEVRSTASVLARQQRTNAAIVRGALAQVSDLLATLRRTQPGSRYDDRASLTAPLPQAAGAGWSA